MQLDKRDDVFAGHHAIMGFVLEKEKSPLGSQAAKSGTFAVGGLLEVFGVVQNHEEPAISFGRLAIHRDTPGKLRHRGRQLELRMLVNLTLPRCSAV